LRLLIKILGEQGSLLQIVDSTAPATRKKNERNLRYRSLIKEIQRNPFDGIGKPEHLKHGHYQNRQYEHPWRQSTYKRRALYLPGDVVVYARGDDTLNGSGESYLRRAVKWVDTG
jgi:Txe/YoeB family toxin of Txe-Axe toxin-antitoxin module